MIEDNGLKYYYDEIFNIIKVISQEQYEMYKQKKELQGNYKVNSGAPEKNRKSFLGRLHTFFNDEEIYSSTENIMVENNEIVDTA
jgi:hypothetical protein